MQIGFPHVGLTIAHDGRGFDPIRPSPGHLPFSRLRERAHAVADSWISPIIRATAPVTTSTSGASMRRMDEAERLSKGL
jgi:hypothetical protein